MPRSSHLGFSLIEVLISLVIASTLAAGAFSAFSAQQLRQKKITAQQELISSALATQTALEQITHNALAGFHQNGRPLCDKLWAARNSSVIRDDRDPFLPIKLSTENDAGGALRAVGQSINISHIVSPNPAPIPLSAPASLSSATLHSFAPLMIGDEILLAQASNPSTCTSRIITNITKNPDNSTTLTFDNSDSTSRIYHKAQWRTPSVSSYPTGSFLIPVKSIITHEIGLRNNGLSGSWGGVVYDRLTYYPDLGLRPTLFFTNAAVAFSYKTFSKSTKSWNNPGDTPNPYDISAIRFSASFYSTSFMSKNPHCTQTPLLFGQPTPIPSGLSKANCRLYHNLDIVLPIPNAP